MQIIEPQSPHVGTFRRKGFRLYAISDCVRDTSGRLRVTGYGESIGYKSVGCFGITDPLEGELAMLDTLDVNQGTPMAVAVNVAPRHCKSLTEGQNGTPFAYTKIGRHVFVSTLSRGLSFSLLRKVGVNCRITVLDTEAALKQMLENGFIKKSAVPHCRDTQFRSLWFQILVAAYLCSGRDLKGESEEQPARTEPGIISIDEFGNCKSDVLPGDVSFKHGETVVALGRSLRCYTQLKDVPRDELAICIGSSGYNQRRFLEVVKNGGSAAQELDCNIGAKW